MSLAEEMARPVDPVVLAEKSAILKALTEPMLKLLEGLHEQIAFAARGLVDWRAGLAEAGLSYVDYSVELSASLTSKALHVMLRDRLANPEKWVTAALNSERMAAKRAADDAISAAIAGGHDG